MQVYIVQQEQFHLPHVMISLVVTREGVSGAVRRGVEDESSEK